MRASIWPVLAGWLLTCTPVLAQLQVIAPALPQPIGATPAAAAPIEGIDCFAEDCPQPGNRFWVQGEYLLWWEKKAPLAAPLVTYGSDLDTPLQGVIGQPGTTIAYGGAGVNFGAFSGYRVSGGLALTEDGWLAVEGSWMQLEKRSVSFNAASNAAGDPVIARPIINAVTGAENSELESSPLVGVAGGISIASSSRLQGWDLNLALARQSNSALSFRGLLGFRALDLTESLVIQDTFRDITGFPGGAGLTFLGAPVLTAAPLMGLDSFRTYNHFYGPQVGSRLLWNNGLVSLGLLGKVALGCNQELVVINGSSSAVVNPGEGRTTVPGGVLTQGSNIGRYFRNEFAVVPEGGLDLGVQLTEWLRASVGYTFLYCSNVVRPGDALDRTVNRFNVPTDQNFGMGSGPARASFTFHGSDYWAQGINFGLALRY